MNSKALCFNDFEKTDTSKNYLFNKTVTARIEDALCYITLLYT